MRSAADAANLRQRIISAIVLAAVVLVLTWAGGIWFRLLAAVIGAAVLYEWLTMSAPGTVHRLLLAALLAVVLVMLVAGSPATTLLLVLGGAIVIGVVHALVERRGFWPVAGLAYAGFSALSLAKLRGDDFAGLAAILFLFAVVWATDILAYFSGRRFGGPKLAPSISPGKTWSGAIGGTLSGVLAGTAAAMVAGGYSGIAAIVLLAFALSVVSQIGDLFESSIKRRFSVKDSSQLIPGHGGVMDRVDGLVAAAFAFFVIGALTAGGDFPAHAFFGR